MLTKSGRDILPNTMAVHYSRKTFLNGENGHG
jgi:hypothetical protein